MGSWAVRAAVLCRSVEQGPDESVVGIQGISNHVLAPFAGDYHVVGVFYVSLVALAPVGPCTTTLVIHAPDGRSLSGSSAGWEARDIGDQIEGISGVDVGLPAPGLYWFALEVDGTEVTRVPLHLRVALQPPPGPLQ